MEVKDESELPSNQVQSRDIPPEELPEAVKRRMTKISPHQKEIQAMEEES